MVDLMSLDPSRNANGHAKRHDCGFKNGPRSRCPGVRHAVFQIRFAPCPQKPVIWERFDEGLQITPADDDADLFIETLQNMSLRAVISFLEETAQKDPKYHWLAPPTVN